MKNTAEDEGKEGHGTNANVLVWCRHSRVPGPVFYDSDWVACQKHIVFKRMNL